MLEALWAMALDLALWLVWASKQVVSVRANYRLTEN
jgi:hypothetical protein